MGCDGAPGSMRFKCVHEDQVCDGVPTCQDMSDEMDCFHFTDPLVPPASGQRLWCVLPSPTLVYARLVCTLYRIEGAELTSLLAYMLY